MTAEPKQAEANFASGDMSRHVVRLSGYMILGFLAMTLSQFVEAVYLGIVGTEAIAAVTFTFPVMMALGAATRGIGMGTGAVLARVIGGGDRQRAEFLTSHGLLLVLVFNVACSVALVVFASWRPAYVLAGAYLFGGVTIMQFHLQGIALASQILAMLPYLATIAVLVLISRRGAATLRHMPASLGKPFHPER